MAVRPPDLARLKFLAECLQLERTRLRNDFYPTQYEILREQNTGLVKELEATDARIESLINIITSLRSKNAEQKRTLVDRDVKLFELTQMAEKLKQEKEQFHAIIIDLYVNKGIFKLTDTVNKFHAIIVALYDDIFELLDKIRTLEGESEEKTKHIRILNERLKRKEGLLSQLKDGMLGQFEDQERELKIRGEEISILEELQREKEAKIERLTSDNRFLVDKTNGQSDDMDRLTKKIQDLTKEIQDLKNTNTILSTQHNSLKTTFDELMRKVTTAGSSSFKKYFSRLGRSVQSLCLSIFGGNPYVGKMLRSSRNQICSTIAQTRKKIKDLNGEIQDLREKLSSSSGEEAKSIENDLQEKIGELTGLQKVLQNYQSQYSRIGG